MKQSNQTLIRIVLYTIYSVLIAILFLTGLLIGNTLKAQNVVIRPDSNYQLITRSYKDTIPDIKTGRTAFTTDGNEYPVYLTKRGKEYILRISKKTGKEYKYYLNKKPSF